MANEDNLKMFGSGARSESEEKELRTKGGLNSGAARRRKKNMKQSAKALMDMPVSKALKQKMKLMGISEDDATYQMAVMVSMLQGALGGDVRAAQFVREMVGEDPKQEMSKREFKLKSDEFKYKKEQNTKMEDEKIENSAAPSTRAAEPNVDNLTLEELKEFKRLIKKTHKEQNE